MNLESYLNLFKSQQQLIARSLERISDEEFMKPPAAGSNSIAVILKHLGGNMHSRWRDFLTTDGEKPDRNRDSEFVTSQDTRATVMEVYERGLKSMWDTLYNLQSSDLKKTIRIRGEEMSAEAALLRQISHYGYHTGQIVYIAKMFRGNDWTTLSM